MRWVVEPEYIACIAILIIFLYTFQEHASSLLKLRVFRISCGISLFAIAVNILSVYAIEHAGAVPYAFNLYINSLYFVATTLMLSAICAYALVLMFEGRYTEKRLHHALAALLAVFLCGVVCTVINLRTGWLFSFDQDNNYVRGPLNAFLYAALIADVIIVTGCHFFERKRVSRSFARVSRAIVPMAMIIGAMQLLWPNTMLSGTIAALTLLILFINGQQQRASTDHLTELFNRVAFFELITRNVQRERPFRVCAVSLRDYKSINTRCGQRAGDAFLHAVGRFLREVHPGAQACRFSGVEFAIIVPDMPAEQYEALHSALKARFRRPWRLPDGTEATLNACFADISYPDIVADVDDLMASLEYAVRVAKSDPTGAPVHFDKARKQELGRRNYIIDLLTAALLKDRFYLHYQPIFDVSRGRCTGAEALLRLREENGTPVSPGEFIPLAEEVGLISELSWLVLDRACRFLAENRDAGVEWISVNVSALEFRSREIVSRVFRTLDRYRLPHGRLKIEITERVILDDLPFAASLIQELRTGGVGVWLDDFGTGYSNLVNVALLPFECLKMDRMFLPGIENDLRTQRLCRTIVQSARELGMEVLFEGVETASQDGIVRAFGVDRIQGYLYARPLEGDALIALMREQDAAPARMAERGAHD